MKIEPVVVVSNGQFTEIATEGFAHPDHVIGEWAVQVDVITVKLTNEYSSIFIYSLDQKKSFQCNRCHGKL
jgi:hypothetical protein